MKNESIIIIGAGPAGLSCYGYLRDHGIKSVLLEARDRIGGRVHTILPHDDQVPIELGAEFIHGTPDSILSRMQAHALPFVDIPDAHLVRRNQILKPDPDFFEKMAALMKRLRSPAKSADGDRSIAEFLDHARRAKKISPAQRKMFQSFVEGFHSADISKIGEQGLASTEETEESDLNGVEQFRHTRGYHAFLETIAPDAAPLLNHDVQKIEWRKGQVRIAAHNLVTKKENIYVSEKAVITVPLGVLKSRDVIHPRPKPFVNALTALETGHVVRLVLKFRNRFWEQLSDKPVSFLHAEPEHMFPTWWTYAPLRLPYLVAWQGGPKAEEMSRLPLAQLTELACETLAYISGFKKSFVLNEVVSSHHHNWTADPFSMGAYSYVAVGGVNKWKRLTRPFDDTLYFCGEATAAGSERGTVHGAIDSGIRTAKQILKSIRG